MKCKDIITSVTQGLTVTSTLAVLGFVIGAVADHVTNRNFDTVLETAGISGAVLGGAGLLLSIGMFAVTYSQSGSGEESPVSNYGAIQTARHRNSV